MKQGILFDLDGTLWDSVACITPAWNRVLAAYGVTVTTPYLRSLMGKTAEEFASALLPGLDPTKEGLAAVDACCREELIELKLYGGILYPGLRETLEALKPVWRLYIVSNCQEGYIDAFLDHHGFRDLFDGYLDHSTGLSKGGNIRLLCQREGLDRAVYVGDTAGDEGSAREAGIPFLHAAYGFGEAKAPDGVIHSLSELQTVLDARVSGVSGDGSH